MNTKLRWNEGMKFTAESGDNRFVMDAKTPIGRGEAMTPKEALLASMAGCTAMDVVALMRKYKQTVESFEVETDAELTTGVQPAVFTSALVTFRMTGPVEREKLVEAVRLSQTKFCGVTAMLVKAFPVHYRIELNGELIGEGDAKF